MTTQVLNNFVRGKVDIDLNGRFDLPIFQNGFEHIKNFISNYKGNLKYRTGFLYESRTKDNNPARLIQFRFNTDQCYLLEITDNYIRFYGYDRDGNFGYIKNDQNQILELRTDIPYVNAQYFQYAQNSDVMYLTAAGVYPRKLKRTAANAFSIENATPTGFTFNDTGYPSSCSFYKGRLWYGAFSQKPTTIKASKVANYDNFTIPSSNIKDDDALSLTLSDITDPISWIRGGKKNLIVGNPEGISIVNGGSADEAITSTKVNADLANRKGASIWSPTEKDGKMIYVSNDRKRCYAFDYDLVSESFISQNLNLLNENLANIVEIFYKRDQNNMIYARTSDGQMLSLIYNKDENIIGWFPIETNGRVVSCCTVVRPDGKDDLFACVFRNGFYYIERLADEVDFTNYLNTDFRNDPDKANFNLIQLEEAKRCVYLDCATILSDRHRQSITYNGTDTVTCAEDVFMEQHVGHRIVWRTLNGTQKGELLITEFVNAGEVRVEQLTETVTPLTWDSWYITVNSVGGLEDVDGYVQSVVADGGYIGDFLVQNGRINLSKEYTSVIVGYKYEGLAQTFNIGTYDAGRNGQTMKKRISEFTLRFVNSAGFKVGTELSNMQTVQLFNPNGYYDAIPLLMNDDEMIVGYNDLHDKTKKIFLQQDEPLPACLTMCEYKIAYEALE